MTKPAYFTISYVVYPPMYKPGDGYRSVKNIKAAKKVCRSRGYGVGSKIVRHVNKGNCRKSIYYSPYRNLGKNGRRYYEYIYNGK